MLHGDLRIAAVGAEEVEHGLFGVEHIALCQTHMGQGRDAMKGVQKHRLIFQVQLLFAGGEAAGQVAAALLHGGGDLAVHLFGAVKEHLIDQVVEKVALQKIALINQLRDSLGNRF